jgi:hypothetical protein
MNGISTQGMVYIHSAPRALLPHVEWALGRLLGGPIGLDWQPQNQAPGQFRAETNFSADLNFGALASSELLGWGSLRFEIVQDAANEADGWRWAFTPSLGLFQGQLDSLGNLLVNEHRVRAIFDSATDLLEAKRLMARSLGEPWDVELEPFRFAHDEASVVWLKSVSN